jgi:hypothetical protein
VLRNAASNRTERLILGHSEMIVLMDDRVRATASCPDLGLQAVARRGPRWVGEPCPGGVVKPTNQDAHD